MINIEDKDHAVMIHGGEYIADVAGYDAGEAHECFCGQRSRRGMHDVRNASMNMRTA